MDRGKSKGGLLIVLVVVFVIVGGYRLMTAQHRKQAIAKQKEAYDKGLATTRVWCEVCGTASNLDVAFENRHKFHECPNCHEMMARPVTYWYCTNESCNRQLVAFPNHVWDKGLKRSRVEGPICPVCGEARWISPQELHLGDARRIAEETGQPFPPEENW